MANQKKVYPVEDVKKGDYMVWSVCSQAERTAMVELKDDSYVYATINKTSHSTELQDLTSGTKGCLYKGGRNLRFEVTIFDASAPQQGCKSVNGILDKKARFVGRTMSICIEDGIDNDFNDLYITLTSWKNKG
ncbi:MAG: hypothetical protein LUH01_10535 [Parabacteroides gordonii]|nr:hypothetical protein [Parabacteroides gordonii]